jgi:hypothetical protein
MANTNLASAIDKLPAEALGSSSTRPRRRDKEISRLSYTAKHRKHAMNILKKLMAFKTFTRVFAGLTLSAWALILTLVALLIFAAVVAYLGWTSAPDTVVPASGYVALVLGVVFSLFVGIGLMSLVFYSSRHGYDEPPKSVDDDTHPNL